MRYIAQLFYNFIAHSDVLHCMIQNKKRGEKNLRFEIEAKVYHPIRITIILEFAFV